MPLFSDLPDARAIGSRGTGVSLRWRISGSRLRPAIPADISAYHTIDILSLGALWVARARPHLLMVNSVMAQ